MAQFTKIASIILVLFIVACSAESFTYRQRLTGRKLQPLRQRPAVQQKRVLARQEAVTPYPTADELKPEVPFEEGHIPDEVYGPPDEVYGPPEIDQTPADQLPSEEAPIEFAFSSDAEEFKPLEAEQISRLTNTGKRNKKNVSSRLVQKKKTRNFQRLIVTPAKIVAAPASIVPAKSPYIARSQKYYFSKQPFAYTARYKAW